MTPFKPASLLFALPAVFCTMSLLAGCGGGGAPPVAVTGPAYVLTDISNGRSDGATAINSLGEALVTSGGIRTLVVDYAAYNASRAARRSSSRSPALAYSAVYDGAHFQDLGGVPYALNDGGQIVFDGGVGPAASSDFNYFVPIPPIGAMIPSNTVMVQPFALNNKGQAVGTSPLTLAQPSSASSAYHAFLYPGPTTVDLGTLGEPTPISFPPDTSTDVSLPGNHSNSAALGINDAGQVVGVSGTGARNAGSAIIQHAFMYQDGRMIDLGPSPALSSFAAAINSTGLIVGAAQKDNGTYAALWQNGQIQYLDTSQPYSYALAVNDAAQIVGTIAVPSNSQPQTGIAFVYRDGKMLDLNKQVTNISGWTLNMATGINSKGQICGVGTYKGLTRAFLLTPQ